MLDMYHMSSTSLSQTGGVVLLRDGGVRFLVIKDIEHEVKIDDDDGRWSKRRKGPLGESDEDYVPDTANRKKQVTKSTVKKRSSTRIQIAAAAAASGNNITKSLLSPGTTACRQVERLEDLDMEDSCSRRGASEQLEPDNNVLSGLVVGVSQDIGIIEQEKETDDKMDTYSDIDCLLEDSSSSDEEEERSTIVTKNLRVMLERVNSELIKENDNSIDDVGSDTIEIMTLPESDTSGSMVEVVEVNSTDSVEVVNLSVSSHSPSSQPSHWTAPEETRELLILPRLEISRAKDKIIWWLSTVGLGGRKLCEY